MVARRAGSLGHGCRSQISGWCEKMAREVTTSRSRSCASTCTWLFPRSFCVPTRNNVSSVPPTAATQRAASVSNTAELIAECAGLPDREGGRNSPGRTPRSSP